MKILYISSSAPLGKGEEFVIDELNAIAKHNVHVLLAPAIIRNNSANRHVLDERVELIEQKLVSYPVIRCFLGELFRAPFSLFSVLGLALSWNPVVLSKNLLVAPKAIWLGRFARECGVDHIHAHWASTPSTLAMLVGEMSNITWSFTAHRSDIVSNNVLSKKLTHASFIRFISKSGIKLAEKYTELPGNKVKMLHMGVEIPDSVCRSGDYKKNDKFVILCPANMIPVKGHSFLIEALSLSLNQEKIELKLAGSGPLKEALEKQVKRLGLDGIVKFLGHVPHDELISMYRMASIDAVILPSLDLGDGLHEGIPVSLMEAMSYSIPVISTSTGGIPELLHDGAGVLVTQGNAQALADAIDHLISEQLTAQKIAKKGRVRVDEQFNLDSIAKTLVEWFEMASSNSVRS